MDFYILIRKIYFFIFHVFVKSIRCFFLNMISHCWMVCPFETDRFIVLRDSCWHLFPVFSDVNFYYIGKWFYRRFKFNCFWNGFNVMFFSRCSIGNYSLCPPEYYVFVVFIFLYWIFDYSSLNLSLIRTKVIFIFICLSVRQELT